MQACGPVVLADGDDAVNVRRSTLPNRIFVSLVVLVVRKKASRQHPGEEVVRARARPARWTPF